MYTPTFTLTHKTVHYLIKLELALRDIRETPLTVTAKKELVQRMGAENLFNLGRVSGAEISFKKAQEIFGGQTISAQKPGERLISNYRSTSDFIFASGTDRYLAFAPPLLLHLNKLVMNDVVESWDIGRFRHLGDIPNPQFDKWSQLKGIDLSLQQFETHFSNVMNWFSDTKHLVHPVIKIGCIIYELVKRYPFVAGNQVTILAITELLFERTKLSLSGLFPVCRSFSLYEAEYKEALEASMSKGEDQTIWIERFTRGVSLDFNALRQDIVRLEEEKIHKRKKRLLDLNARQLKLIRILEQKPKVKRQEYVRIMGVSTMTAYRDLDVLVKRKIIRVSGGGRSTYYSLIRENDGTPVLQDTNQYRRPEVVKVINGIEQ